MIRPRNSRFEAVPGITNAIQISAGGTSTCALLADATLRCWGAPAPVLGRRDHLTEAPVTPIGLPPVVQVDVGERHACATTASGEVWCWGWNTTNMLGNLYRSPSSYQPVDRFDEAWIDGQ